MKQFDLKTLRHSAAHLAAHAVQELYPDTLLTIGPPTETGFFYDVLPVQNFKEEDLVKIEERMHEIAKRNIPMLHTEVSKEEGRTLFKNNPFKMELIDGIPGDTVGVASQGDFYDLCRGGHVDTTGQIQYFKLESLSGSYWRADRSGQALQRISGTAYFSEKDLADYLQRKEDLLKYDHRRLGKQLDLFSFHDESPGSVFYHNKGKIIVNLMMSYMRSLLTEFNYQEIQTPIILVDTLWKQSGHYAHYKENMYFVSIDEQQYAVKPMNCPGSILVYKERPHSYRELPLRLAEFGLVHRYELSGALHGLMRVRSFTQDDAHLYCTVDQIEQEITTMLTMAYIVYRKFGFENIKVNLSTRPANSMGNDASWDKATQALRTALENAKIEYTFQEGEGAFYGPKIDLSIEDSMGRQWQCGTIQADFTQPENFDLSYIAAGGAKERPVMLHRTLYGSLERFFGILLEHHKGKLPFWIAPVQIRVLTITDEQKDYARAVVLRLKQEKMRAELDESSDQISAQIKSAQLEYIPWMVVIGAKEVANNTVTLRHLDGKQEFGLTIEQLLAKAYTQNV